MKRGPIRYGARSRGITVRRVLGLWRAIEGLRRRPPVNQLAQRFQVHPRTIRRDIAVLEELHFAVPPAAREDLYE